MGDTGQGLRLGTRGSELALTQTRMVIERLRGSGWEEAVETCVIQTTGDRRQDLRLASPGLDKAVFTKELEEALLRGEIDAAVHSLKDVPTQLEAGFELVAVLPRAPVEDVLVTREVKHAAGGIETLPGGAVVATSSLRRAFQLRHLRPDLRTVDIRGNVPTRLRKVATQGDMDATILARAGLERLGYRLEGPVLDAGDGVELGAQVLSPGLFLPAAGQGAIALEIRAGNERAVSILQRLNDPGTWQRVRLERAFLHAIGAGCQTPVGILTRLEESGTVLQAEVMVFEPAGGAPRRASVRGPAGEAEQLARELSKRLS